MIKKEEVNIVNDLDNLIIWRNLLGDKFYLDTYLYEKDGEIFFSHRLIDINTKEDLVIKDVKSKFKYNPLTGEKIAK